MSEGIAEVRELLAKAKNTISRGRESIEETTIGLTGVVAGTVLSSGLGAGHQYFGKEKAGGVRVVEVGGTHADLLGCGGALAVTMLGGFGKARHMGFTAAQTFGNGWGRDSGRIAAAVLMEKRDSRKTADKSAEAKPEAKPEPAKKTGT